MIKSLTKEQEAQIPKFIEKWINMASAPTNRKRATKAVQDIYESMGEERPIVIFGQSPYSTALMAAIVFEIFKTSKGKRPEKLNSQLYSHLGSQLNSQLYSQLDSQLYSQLYSQ